MRFLVDQDVYQATIQWLIEKDHDIILAKDLNLQRAPDVELLERAEELGRLLLTRDKDFGTLVFLRGEPSQGVIRLAIDPKSVDSVHRELGKLLENHGVEELSKAFSVVEPNRHRIRKLG